MMKICRALALAWGLLCLPAAAHEFWLWPQSFAPAVKSGARLTMHVGEFFEGEPAGFTAAHAAAMRLHARDKTEDLRERLPAATAWPELRLPLARPGAHVVTYDSVPSSIVLPAEKFHAYLHEEGLDAVIRKREAAGAAALPGHERYRRCIKTLLMVGGKTDATVLARTGQRLEIVPLTDPHTMSAGDALSFQLMFDDQPLAGALVKAWHKRDGQLVVIRARTNEEGKAALSLPFTGPWMISVVHMIAADTPGADWDSFWGNLTFALPN
ncbi:MAG: DUF4198 domain-containing protein [Burkholderiales bacterium]|nr:DUF4198 domain-containing protein [Burkholderiales bacterium]